MAVTQVFRDKNRAFWILQIVGWAGYILVRTLHGLTAGQEVQYYFPVYLAATAIGFSMTLLMRLIYRQVRTQSLGWVFASVTLVCAAFGLIFSSIELSVDAYVFKDDIPLEGLARFSNAMFETTVLFAWSALYFGYHYYSGFNEQRERALRALAMAHQAQLKMLRYQLNPHFLFNTLNAISTLVLERAAEDANEMLTKLSSFLRYTLHNQPAQKVTLDQELHALSLYLDIEKVRFQTRLHVTYDIDEEARSFLIPSLILQPLVENAIKYAVAPSLDGGTIHICAKTDGNRLTMALVDTGPGVEDTHHLISQTGSGVGLVNTQDRLAQLYGDQHHFTVRNMDEGGLGLFIDIPAERKSGRPLAS